MVENSPQQEPTYYQDPELLKRAGDDKELLSRLVALKQAEDMFAETPDNDSFRRLLEVMKTEVESYESSRGRLQP